MAEAAGNREQVQQARDLLTADYAAKQEFNDQLDADGDVFILPNQPDDNPSPTYAKSGVLYWLDPILYENTRQAWEDQTVYTEHEAAIKLIVSNKQQAYFAELVTAVRRRRVVPFVGAGLSAAAPMNMPLWGEALERIKERIKSQPAGPFKAALRKRDYFAAAQLLFDSNATLAAEYISSTYGQRDVVLRGPICLLHELAEGSIVTTNFDEFIEQALTDAQKPLSATFYGLNENVFFPRLTRGDRCLLKLHGDAQDDRTHVFTFNQYVEKYGQPFDFTKPLPKALRQIYVGSSLLFLGCALENDWTMDLFRQVKQTNEYEVPKHFAVMEAPGNARKQEQKATELLTCNIQPIWYPHGQHQYVEKLLLLLLDVVSRRVTLK